MRSKLKNESGVVLVMVLAISIVMMIFTIGILSTNMNQILLGEKTIQRIKAEQYGKGIFWVNYSRLFFNQAPLSPGGLVIDARNYLYNVATVGTLGGPNETQQYDININY